MRLRASGYTGTAARSSIAQVLTFIAAIPARRLSSVLGIYGSFGIALFRLLFHDDLGGVTTVVAHQIVEDADSGRSHDSASRTPIGEAKRRHDEDQHDASDVQPGPPGPNHMITHDSSLR